MNGARIVAFRPRDPMLEFHCRRRAESARDLQAAQDRLAEAQRRRDALLDEAAAVAARVAAMSPAERAQRAAELGLAEVEGLDLLPGQLTSIRATLDDRRNCEADRRLLESLDRSGVFPPPAGPEVA